MDGYLAGLAAKLRCFSSSQCQSKSREQENLDFPGGTLKGRIPEHPDGREVSYLLTRGRNSSCSGCKLNYSNNASCELSLVESVYLAGYRLSVVEQVVFLHFPIFCLQLGRLSVLCIVQQHIYFTYRPKQTS